MCIQLRLVFSRMLCPFFMSAIKAEIIITLFPLRFYTLTQRRTELTHTAGETPGVRTQYGDLPLLLRGLKW